jgi:hypothetical protein
MTKLLDLPVELERRRIFGVFDDFNHYTTAENFTSIVTDTGTIAGSDAAGGILVITPSDGTAADNDEAYLKGTHEVFKFAADKPMVFEAKVKMTATAISTCNVIVGVKDAVAANSLLDDGGGPAASYSGAVFFDTDGGLYWNCESSIAGSQTTVLTDVFIDGVEVGLNNGACHLVTFASATEMQVCIGCKAGAATNGEILYVDYVGCWQLR